MNDINMMLKKVIPEKILDFKFKEMRFTTEMLDIYYVIDGRKSLTELSNQLSMDIVKLIEHIKKMREMGLVKVQKSDGDPSTYSD